MMKCIVPVVMAGIIAIYGLVVSVLISGDLKSPMALYTGFIQLGAGLSVGLAGLAAGFAVGIVGDAGVRGVAQQVRHPRRAPFGLWCRALALLTVLCFDAVRSRVCSSAWS